MAQSIQLQINGFWIPSRPLGRLLTLFTCVLAIFEHDGNTENYIYTHIVVIRKSLIVHFLFLKYIHSHMYHRIRSDQISCSVVSDSVRPHESQHTRPPSPSPTPGVHSNSCPSSQWCHLAISSSVVPFSSCPQSLPAWGGQSTGVSALASFLPKNTQGWSPSEWTGWISLQPKGLSRVFSNTPVQKHQFFSAQPSSQSNSHIHTWPQEKP